MKKGITIGTLIGLSACAIMLILTIFKINFFKGAKLDILVTVAALTAGGYFSLSSYNVIKRNRILGIISIILISASTLLIIIGKLGSMKWDFFKITIAIALVSILFNFIVSTKLKLGKSYSLLQIICYVILTSFISICVMLLLDIIKFKTINTLFWILIILSVVLSIAVSILSNKNRGFIEDTTDDYIKITKKEYQELIEKAKKLDSMTK